MSKQNFEGFALAQIPTNLYTTPEIRGISGRYIRLLPSLISGDGFLSVSQVQVLDTYGNNIALQGTATASSTGGSPLDKRYGSFVMNGTAKVAAYGVSKGPEAAIDGVLTPRDDLISIFETSIQNKCSGSVICGGNDHTLCPTSQCANGGIGNLPYDTRSMIGCDKRALDNQYWELDLGADNLIKTIIYTGRSNPQNDLNAWQGCRVNGMRLLVLNSARKEVYNSTTAVTPVFTTNDYVQRIEFPNPVFHDIKVLQSTVDMYIPNINAYKTFMNAFAKQYMPPPLVPMAGTVAKKMTSYIFLSDFLKYTNTVPESGDKNLSQMDISNNLLPAYLSGAQNNFATNYNMASYNFYYDIYKQVSDTTLWCPAEGCKTATIQGIDTISRPVSKPPGLPPPINPNDITIPVQVLGTFSAAAGTEMNNSISLSQKIYLGSPDFIDNYVSVHYPTYTPYIRNQYKYCMPEVIQIFDAPAGIFKNKKSQSNINWNNINCRAQLTPGNLSLLPYGAKNFIAQWVHDRAARYNQYCSNEGGGVGCSASIPVYIPTPPPINVKSVTLINSIAQQFYELLNGDFIMSYIYDVQPIGQTILDIRFDLVVHVNFNEGISGPIADLKRQYQTLKKNNTMSQDMINSIDADYGTQLSDIVNNEIQAVSKPIYGVVARVFYDKVYTSGTIIDTNNLKITGMIFDDRAVTSFLEELNCGIPVPTGNDPGNINIAPQIKYTLNKNIVETLDCTDEQTLKRIMNDYYTTVMNNKNILKKMAPPPNIDTSNTSIFINSILGATQISPTQCALSWSEQLYDPLTNMSVFISDGTGSGGSRSGSGGSRSGMTNIVKRNAVFNYLVDNKNWYVSELNFDEKNIKFYPTTAIPDCIFNPVEYQMSHDATTSMSTADIYKYFSTNTLKPDSGEICPDILPGYTFNADGYVDANSDRSILAANALQDYRDSLAANTNRTVKKNNSIQLFPTPFTYTKPLPYRSNLDTHNNTCPVTNCEDMDVLYSIAEQYNSDTTTPGTIVRITRAFTISPYQCDIEADLTYDGTALNVLSGSYVKKGGVTYSMGSNGLNSATQNVNETGLQKAKTMAINLEIDPGSCVYLLMNAGAPGSGNSIQANTPYLYKSMEYATEFAARSIPDTGSTAIAMTAPTSNVIGSSHNILTNYRVNTYTAAANITGSGSHHVTPSPPAWSDIQNGSKPLTVVSGFTDYSPLSHRAFGLDRARNSDDTYKELQFQAPRSQALPKAQAEKPYPAYKYLRFHPIKLRLSGAGVSVGKFSFFFNEEPVELPSTSVLNRMGTWSGTVEDVTGPGIRTGFHDDHMKPLVFAFSKPIVIDAYSLTTSTDDTDCDPVSWKLEGSSTGTYWQTLHTQNQYPTPVERSTNLPVFSIE